MTKVSKNSLVNSTLLGHNAKYSETRTIKMLQVLLNFVLYKFRNTLEFGFHNALAFPAWLLAFPAWFHSSL